MQVKDLIVTGDAKILGNLYTKDGNVGAGGGAGGGEGGSSITYKLTKSGQTITLTGSDGSTSSVTDANTDTNTTYSAGTGISLSGTTFSNSGVRSIATGSSNGTISVNTNGTSANVAVKGLGSAAYTASTAYAASSHTHDDRYFTESEINSKLSGYAASSHSHGQIQNGTVGIKVSDSNEVSFISNTNYIYFGYDNRMGSSVAVDTYKFGKHSGTANASSGTIECGTVIEGGTALSSKYAPIRHSQAASTITAGTFAGQVVAKSSGQAVGTSLLRNSKLVSTKTYAEVNGEINWLYG